MRVIRGLPASADVPVALTIGNFDGVHRGHQAMLARLIEGAEDLRLTPAVLTFDPHPREFFAPDNAPPRLHRSARGSRPSARWACGARSSPASTAGLPSLSRRGLHPRRAEGALTRAGCWSATTSASARAAPVTSRCCAPMRERFSVEGMRTVEVGAERASSSAVRAALAAGDLARAKALLGRAYTISGRVAHGDKLGRDLGFPTANLPLRRTPPLAGIFAVRVHGLGVAPRPGVASVGVRPTVKSDGQPLVEVFIFDFEAPIYGRRITVEFLRKLRDEARYRDLAALTDQIRTDAEQARAFFATQ